MAIDLNKDKNELKYYYSENGATLGPFSLSQLLEKIEADTLVYRDGIDWTNAKDVEELKKFFKTKQIKIETSSEQNKNITNIKSKTSNKWIIISLILIVFFSFSIFIFLKFNTSKVEKNMIKETDTKNSSLSEFDIFEFDSIRTFIPSNDQKISSEKYIEDAYKAIENKEYSSAIMYLKES
ncbi:MAG: domain 2, partial [Bacteroidota bacterium]